MKTKTKEVENKVKELNDLLNSCIIETENKLRELNDSLNLNINEEEIDRIFKQEDKTELIKLMSFFSVMSMIQK